MVNIQVKDKIVLAVYMPSRGLSSNELEERTKLISATLVKDDSVIYYVIPNESEDNVRIECVYPKFLKNNKKQDNTNNILDRLLKKIIDNEK